MAIYKLGLQINRHNVLFSNKRQGIEVLAEAIEYIVKKQDEIIDTINELDKLATQNNKDN